MVVAASVVVVGAGSAVGSTSSSSAFRPTIRHENPVAVFRRFDENFT